MVKYRMNLSDEKKETAIKIALESKGNVRKRKIAVPLLMILGIVIIISSLFLIINSPAALWYIYMVIGIISLFLAFNAKSFQKFALKKAGTPLEINRFFYTQISDGIAENALRIDWKDNPPKDRNGVSGYRTAMSKLNDETWKCAHKYWGRISFVSGIILAIASLFVLIFMKDDANFEMISVYLVFFQLGVMALTIIPTEFLLHKRFTKQGVKKK